jgi:hypothetical protein
MDLFVTKANMVKKAVAKIEPLSYPKNRQLKGKWLFFGI